MENQIIAYISFLVMGVLIGLLLRDLFVLVFESNKNFKVANLEELPDGKYGVISTLPVKKWGDFNFQEVFLIKSFNENEGMKYIMSVFFGYDLLHYSKDKGKILSFSLLNKKDFILIQINFENPKESMVLKLMKGSFSCGHRWEKTSQAFA